MATRGCVILFVKAPVPGAVKTRLCNRIDPETVAKLYRGFVADILHTLSRTGFDIRIAHDPPDAGKAISGWLGTGYPLIPQNGADLGARMRSAFADAFAQGYETAVLLGSDIPDLPAEIIHEAFDALERFPAVIGPSQDGGYYLIGFRSDGFAGQIFENMIWSTELVFKETMDRFAACGSPVHVLPEWRDVDTGEDLDNLKQRIGEAICLPETRKILSQLKDR